MGRGQDEGGIRLVFLYGPPGAGKLTVARELAALTGFGLFHNHLTVDLVESVFPRGSEAFGPLVHRFRREMFAAAAREDVDLVFTFVYAHPEDAPGVRPLIEPVLASGGAVHFVRLACPREELLARVAGESRRAYRKLTDPAAVGALLDRHDLTAAVPFAESLRLDTAAGPPAEGGPADQPPTTPARASPPTGAMGRTGGRPAPRRRSVLRAAGRTGLLAVESSGPGAARGCGGLGDSGDRGAALPRPIGFRRRVPFLRGCVVDTSALRYVRSVVAGESFVPLLVAGYDLPLPVVCRLAAAGDNDNYYVWAGPGRAPRYVLRLLRADKHWLPADKAEAYVAFELDWLRHAHARGAPVPCPVAGGTAGCSGRWTPRRAPATGRSSPSRRAPTGPWTPPAAWPTARRWRGCTWPQTASPRYTSASRRTPSSWSTARRGGWRRSWTAPAQTTWRSCSGWPTGCGRGSGASRARPRPTG